MKKELHLQKFNFILLFAFLFLGMIKIQAQEQNNPKPFIQRYTNELKGELTMIANGSVNRNGSTTPYNGSSNNNNQNIQYVDIDDGMGFGNSGGDTFSSTSAELIFPTTAFNTNSECFNVVYAGLYWSGMKGAFNQSGRVPVGQDVQNIKLIVPGSTTYVDIQADDSFEGSTTFNSQRPYYCYADITDLVTPLTDAAGDYFVANVRSLLGQHGNGGGAAGWVIVFVYENPQMPGKYISTFDGFDMVDAFADPGDEQIDFTYSGFTTVPNPFPVNARIGIAAIEGDRSRFNIGGQLSVDGLEFRAASNPSFTGLPNDTNPNDNYFDSTITIDGANFNDRTPNSSNLLGFDADIFELENGGNLILPNNETSATIRATTTADRYGIFLNTFSVEIIEPDIQISKTVEDGSGIDIGGTPVNLGQEIEYVISFQNVGNDDGSNFTILDNLPVNVDFEDIASNLTMPPGVTYVYDPGNHTLLFTIPDNLVVQGVPDPQEIRFSVNVVNSCFQLRDACSNIINNQAFGTYRGVLNSNVVNEESFYGFDTCDFGLTGPTNFIADLDDCDFRREEILCGDSIVITAGSGFDSYTWYDAEVGGNVVGTTQSITVNSAGTYRVEKTAPAPCLSFDEFVDVVPFTNSLVNPAVTGINNGSINGVVETCLNDGTDFPKIFLCGLNDTALIDTDINVDVSNGESIIWETINPASCTDAGTPNDSCPNIDSACTWTQIHSGNDYIANTSGEFRLTVTYQNGCFRRFYFDVYENILDPQVSANDIICNTQGNITVDSPSASSGYEYQLVDNATGVTIGAYQASNSFTITTAGEYVVNIRQTGVTGGCIFQTDPEEIRERVPVISVNDVDPLCAGSLGSATLQLTDVEPDYTFTLIDRDTGNTLQTAPAQAVNFHEFTGLAVGNYTGRIQTSPDGCNFTIDFEIVPQSNITLTATVSQDVTCREGNIQVNAGDGQPPYSYAIYSYNGVPVNPASYVYQTSVIFDVLAGDEGLYEFIVVDDNNCTAVSNEVEILLIPPMDYTVTSTDETCFGANDGTITINMIDDSGYSVEYSIDGGTNFQNSGSFSALTPGPYDVVVRGSRGNRVCDFPEPTLTINAATPMTGSASLTQGLACPAQLGIITFGASTGGSGSYEYSINGGASYQPSNVFNNLSDGTYTPVIRDLNNTTCTITLADITINPLNPPTDLDFASSTITCNAPATDVTVTTTGGTGTLNYEITAAPGGFTIPPSNTTGVFTNLDPGTYTFLVSDADGCTYNENYTINDVTPISLVGTVVSDVTCVGDNDGEVSFTVSDFSTTYSYTVNGGAAITGQSAATINLPGLIAGSYDIEVTDETTGCTDDITLDVDEPVAPLDLPAPTITDINCNALGFDPGSATSTATGGWGGYSYELEDNGGVVIQGPQGNGTFSGLVAGTYTIVVTDSNGCEERETFTLSNPVAPVLALTPDITCYTAATPVTVTATISSGGTAPFNYEINTGATNTTGVFSGLTPGTYTITVTDDNGCIDDEVITIDPQLTVTATADDLSTCDVSTNVTITAGGGDTNYVYAIVNDGAGTGAATFGASNVIAVTASGDYDVYVRDNNGTAPFCEAMFDLNIAQDPPIVFNAPAITNVICNGDSTGAIDFTGVASGGQPPYEFSIDNGVTFDPALIYNNLTAGTYNIQVRDAEGCIEPGTAIITQPAAILATASVTRNYTCTQEAQITVDNQAGGSGTYQYSVNGSAWEPAGGMVAGAYTFTSTFTDGNYTVQVRDFNAQTCPFTITPDLVIAPLPAQPTLTPATSYNCNGSGDITVTPAPAGAYTYQLEDLANVAIPGYDFATQGANNVFSGVPVGTYIINVNYATDCFTTIGVTVDPGNEFQAAVTGSTNVTCNGDNDGTITFEAENFDGGTGFEYSVNGGAFTSSLVSPVTVNSLAPLGAPGVEIVVRDLRDITCSVTLNQIITEPTPVVAGGSVTVVATCDDDATIVATANGGTPGYTFELRNNGGTPLAGLDFATNTTNDTFTAIPPANYIIAVQDNNGCIDTFPISVTAANLVTLSTNETNCYDGGSNGVIRVDVLTGNGNYVFSINGAGGPFVSPNIDADTHDFTGLTPGTYNIVVSDGLGCDETASVTIEDEFTASAVLDKDLDCSVSPDAQATITPTGGSGTYTTFEWSDDGGTSYNATNFVGNVFTIGVSGTYQFRVTDDTGCEAETGSIVVTPAVPPQASHAETNVSCFGFNDGIVTITVDPNFGTPPYQINFDGGGLSNQTVYTNLAPGSYTYIVEDSKECTFTDTVIITEPLQILATVGINPITCDVSGTPGTVTAGSFDVVITQGGVADFTYELLDSSGNLTSFVDPNGNPFTTSSTTHTFEGIDIYADYIIRITDANGCEFVQNPVRMPAEPFLSTTVETLVAPNCVAGATVNVTAGGGNGDYNFEIVGPGTVPDFETPGPGVDEETATFSGLSPGQTFNIRITDIASGCIAFEEFTTTPISAMVLALTPTEITCNAADDGQIAFDVTDYDVGTTALDWQVIDAVTNTPLGTAGTFGTIAGPLAAPGTGVSDTATDIPPGTYFLEVTEVGGTLCSVTESFFFVEPTALDVVEVNNINANCNIGAQVTVDPSGGTPDYTFAIVPNGDPAPALAAYGASPVLTPSPAPVAYPADFDIYVMDTSGCTDLVTVTVNEDPAPVISLALVNACVPEGTFEIEVTRTPSAPIDSPAPYTMSVDGGAAQAVTFTANVFTITGLNSGSHTVEVFDANGCSTGAAETIEIVEPIEISADLVTLIDCEGAPNDSAEIEIEVTSIGNSSIVDDYTYQIVGTVISGFDSGVIPFDENADPITHSTGLTVADTYTVTVTDVTTTCSVSTDVVIPARLDPTISIDDFTDVTCEGADDGTITVSVVDNGTGPYTFSITAPAVIAPISTTATTATFENLDGTGGITYTVQVTSANSCTDTDTQLITEPATIVVPAPTVTPFACATGNNTDTALISVDVAAITGGAGVGNYVRYEFTPPGGSTDVVQDGANSDYIVTDVAGGTYTINVYDTNGCVGTINAVIDPFTEISNPVVNVDSAITCTTDEDITVTVTFNPLAPVTPPNMEYVVTGIDNAFTDTVTNSANSAAFTGLGIGNYTVTATNTDTGCVVSTTHEVVDPNTFDITVSVVNDVVCFGDSDGAVNFTLVDPIGGYAGAITYEVFDVATNTTQTAGPQPFGTPGPTTPNVNLPAGDYYVRIIQTANPLCSNDEPFSIAGPPAALNADRTVTPVTCDLGDGIVEIINPTGGWGDYTYYVGTASPANLAAYQASPVFSTLAGGITPGTTYEVWIADINGCEFQLTDAVLVDPDPIAGTLEVNQFNCNGTDGIIEVTGVTGGQGSNYSYQLQDGASTDIGGLETSPIFNSLGAGTYQVVVTDQWNCSLTTNQVTLFEQLNVTAGITAGLTCARNDGEITITLSGGSGNFQYDVTTPISATPLSNVTGVFTGLDEAGTYTITVTDLDTAVPGPACFVTVDAIITEPVDPVFNPIDLTDVSCNGGNDGTATITLTDATDNDPPYTYTITTGPIIPPVNNNGVFIDLPAGNYTFQVESALNCTVTGAFTINEPPAIAATATVTREFACDGTNNIALGQITAVVDGTLTGTSPYLYSIDGTNFFDNAGVFEIIDTGVIQNITVTVRDANGCETLAPVTINPLPVITAVDVTVNTAITCANDEIVDVTVTGGSGEYSFELLPPGSQTIQTPGAGTFTAQFTLTTPGDYVFLITDINTGCTFTTAPYTIAPYDIIGVIADNSTPITCYTDTDGTLDITVTNYTGNYDYQVLDDTGAPIVGLNGSSNTATDPFTINNLPGGNYTVQVTATDTPFCTAESNILLIDSPDSELQLNINVDNEITCLFNDGVLTGVAEGGWGSYQYTLTYPDLTVTAPQPTGTFTGLDQSGTYTITVVDAEGCTIQQTQDLTIPTLITASASQTAAILCNGEDEGEITVTASGGRGAAFYQFILTNTDTGAITAPQVSNIFTGLVAGTYTVTVIDGWDCDVITAPVVITEPTEVIADLIQVSPLTCLTQAQIQVSATGGTGPYLYSDSQSGPFGPQDTFNVGIGQYQYFAQDANGCISPSNLVVIEEIPPLEVIPDDSAAFLACFGDTDAVIRASARGGLGNYMFELLDDPSAVAALQGPQATPQFNNLGVGTYYVRVTSEDCVVVSGPITITEPDPLAIDREEVTNPSCTGEDDGQIIFEVSGGTGIIKYAITPYLDQFDENFIFSDLAPGTYEVIAQDENGCYIIREFEIIDPEPLVLAPGALQQEFCIGDMTGSIEVIITGGTAPYTAAITFPGDPNALVYEDVTDVPNPTSHVFDTLAGGITYTILVEDANGCRNNMDVTLDTPVNLTSDVQVEYGCSENTSTNTVTVIHEDPTIVDRDVIYVLDGTGPGQLENVFENLTPGDHFIEMSLDGCVRETLPFTIEFIEDLTFEFVTGNINQIVFEPAGGVPPYENFIDDLSIGTDTNYYINRTDTYTVTVIDSRGCIFRNSIPMEFIDIVIPPVFTPNGDDTQEEWQVINDEGFPNIVTKIYDRYGRWLGTLKQGDTWKGVYDGSPLPTGDYWYVLKINGENDPREFIGHFTLYR